MNLLNELLSLNELKNHLGVHDKTLVEFIIAQRLESDTFDIFKRRMIEIGGGSFSPSLIESIDRFIRTMYPSTNTKKDATLCGSVKQRATGNKYLALLEGTPNRDLIDDAFNLSKD